MKAKKFKQLKDERKKIALERIEILKRMKTKRPDFSERYEKLINNIKKKYRLQ